MGRLVLVARLAARDVRRRPGEAALLLLAIMAATTTLTLGLALHDVTSEPFQSTRAATAGPDVVASVRPDRFSGEPVDMAGLVALTDAPGVVGHSGPYPVTDAAFEVHGRTGYAHVIGRDPEPAAVDQPALTEGRWVGAGGVVFEAAFADALGVSAGDPITLDGQSFRVVGVAVSAAAAPYPELVCLAGRCIAQAGVIWLTQADARSVAADDDSIAYVLNLKLADPAAAPRFVDTMFNAVRLPPNDTEPRAPFGMSWQDIRGQADNLLRNERRTLVIGGWLLALLAVASVAVLVGGRMADQTRRVGLLKAVGGTPGLVAIVLLAEYVLLALVAAASGLAGGRLAAPLFIEPSAGLIGRAGSPPLAMSTVGVVTAVAVGVAAVATFFPAVRAARMSTVLALADTARPPRRTPWAIAVSARLPVPLLLGLRIAARRPRRAVLGAVSIAVTVSGIVAALAAHADLNADQVDGFRLDSSRINQLDQVLLMITVTLLALAAVNATFITWATALDARHSSALARAIGATPHQVSAGLSAAQVLPALAGGILGIPGGIALFAALGDTTRIPPLWQLLAVMVGTVVVVAALATIPARLGGDRSVAETLRSELT